MEKYINTVFIVSVVIGMLLYFMVVAPMLKSKPTTTTPVTPAG